MQVSKIYVTVQTQETEAIMYASELVNQVPMQLLDRLHDILLHFALGHLQEEPSYKSKIF